MGFFDEFETGGEGGSWVSAEEKQELLDNRTPFVINAVSTQEGDKFGDRYVLDITLDGEARKIGFGIGTVDSRDRMLSAMATYLASTEDAEGPKVALESAGRAILIVQA